MCIIIACPPGRQPNFDNLIDATWENPDGHGWVMQTPNGLEMFRTPDDPDEAVTRFWTARDEYPNGWAVWHSRLATHGGVNMENTHPFQVPGKPWYLMHNGVLPLTDGPFRHDRSDSRILAEDHISQVSWKQMRRDKKEIEKWLSNDKVVLISGRQERGGNVLIFNEHVGKWNVKDKCWYSHPLFGYSWRKGRSNSLGATSYSGSGSSASTRQPAITTGNTPNDDDNLDWNQQDMENLLGHCRTAQGTYIDDTGTEICAFCYEEIDECLCYMEWEDSEEVEDAEIVYGVDGGRELTADEEQAYQELFNEADARAANREQWR